jgi:hypothetical protein
MKTKIDVTPEDIATGDHNGETCPVARALCRTLDVKVGEIVVGVQFITHFGLKGYPRILTPDAVRGFVVMFDNGVPVRPFTFELEAFQ